MKTEYSDLKSVNLKGSSIMSLKLKISKRRFKKPVYNKEQVKAIEIYGAWLDRLHSIQCLPLTSENVIWRQKLVSMAWRDLDWPIACMSEEGITVDQADTFLRKHYK